MNWRWIVPGLLALAFIEAVAGASAYSSTGGDWDAVRAACLIKAPLGIVGGGIFVAGLWLTLDWAARGRR